MTATDSVLGVVPARGGSARIRRKNLRDVGGEPMFLRAAQELEYACRSVVVSTDDAEIASLAQMHGFEVHMRARVEADHSGVLQVAAEVAESVGWHGGVVVLQPDNPLISGDDIRGMVVAFRGETLQMYSGRGLLGCYMTKDFLYPRQLWVGAMDEALLGDGKGYLIADDDGLNVDEYPQLWQAQREFDNTQIIFRVTAGHEQGTGHLHRTVQLATALGHYDTFFLLKGCDSWVKGYLEDQGFRAYFNQVDGFGPDVVLVNDCLDTEIEDVAPVLQEGGRVVCMEDFGEGSRYADLVVQELYEDGRDNAVSGAKWAVTRPEFRYAPKKVVREDAERVVVTFGGSDPAGMTERVTEVLWGRGFDVEVVEPPSKSPSPATFSPLSHLMLDSDLVVTSAGRTVHEAAAMGTPVVSVAVNAREATHVHCPGVVRMGLHVQVSDAALQDTVKRVMGDYGLRKEMSRKLQQGVDGRGVDRIVHRIEGLARRLD